MDTFQLSIDNKTLSSNKLFLEVPPGVAKQHVLVKQNIGTAVALDESEEWRSFMFMIIFE